MKSDSEYLAERLAAEREAAAKAKSKKAKAAHEELADHYESRLKSQPKARSEAPQP